MTIGGAVGLEAARRFLLGRQGLWPGRRWRGKEGAAAAIRALGSVQVDPVTVVARSHDLVLWSRVDGYTPAHLDELLYRDRRFFDYGAHLDIYPMEELPYWRLHMERRRGDARWAEFARENAEVVEAVRRAVAERGPLGSRDLAGGAAVASYRARTDAGLALYNLWLTGELMTAARAPSFHRLYDLRERVAPPEHAWVAGEGDVERHAARNALERLGLGTARAWTGAFAYPLHRRVDRAEARARLDALLAGGEAARVAVEGQRDAYYLPAADLPLLASLEAGQIPDLWRPLGPTTRDEITLLSPLDNLLDRSRTRALWGFEYLWEVYKPAEKRRWGRYTLPVLWGDLLVARLEPRLDRRAAALALDGFWLETPTTGEEPVFAAALGRGLAGFARFLGAATLDLATLAPPPLRDAARESAAATGLAVS